MESNEWGLDARYPAIVRLDAGDAELDAELVAALNALVAARIHASRDEAATWLIREGLAARRGVLEQIRTKVTEIERLRAEARELAHGGGANGDAAQPAPPSTEPPAPSDDGSPEGPTPAE